MKRARTIVFLLFGLSGACGLVYEVAWSRYLSLFMGSTAYSHMIVLATFMGGLALGSWYWGKRADRTADPLRLYGYLEIAIGASGLVYPFLMVVLEKAFLSTLASLELSSDEPVVLALKLGLSTLSLIVPTFCMGGTLPVLLKLVTGTADEAGTRIATLYWINSAGAVLGAGAAGFFLVRLYSIDTAIWVAAAASIGGGILSLALSPVVRRPGDDARPGHPGTPKDGYPAAVVSLAIVAAAASGFISMIYEIAWIRLLSTILGSSTYSFTVMLIAFISGIALGGWIVGRILRRRRNLLLILALCQVGAAVSMLVTMPFYERLPYFLWKLSGAIRATESNFAAFLFLEFVFCLALMIVPTTLSGMSLPVAGRMAAGEMRLLGRRIGGVFSLNTVGAVAGTLLTGLLFIPWLGVKRSIELGVAANALLGLILLSRDGKTATRWKFLLLGGVAILGSSYAAYFPEWNRNVSNLGVYRILHQEIPESYGRFLELMKSRTILWYEEGVTANVAVAMYDRDGVAEKSLVINGKADASTGYDLPTQTLLAHTPLILGPDTGDVLVIGLGSGITAGSALTHPIRSLDCVEISPEVVECNRFFSEENGNFMRDPRARIIVDDAITFVKSGDRRYSCIISEPSNPWIAGIGNLFTTEFFELCKTRLTPDGILAQWFHTYDVSDEVFQLVLRTLSRSFDHVSVWIPGSADVILVASMAPIPADFRAMEAKMSLPRVRADLERIGVSDLPTLLSTQILADVRTTGAVADGPVNTEKHPVLEFLAPVSFFTHTTVGYTREIDRRTDAADSSLLLPRLRAARGLTVDNLMNIARYQTATTSEDFRMALLALTEVLGREPASEEGLTLLVDLAARMGDWQRLLTALDGLVKLHPDDPGYLVQFASVHRAWLRESFPGDPEREIGPYLPTLRLCVEATGGEDERCLLALADALAGLGRFRDAGLAYTAVWNLREIYEPLDSLTIGQIGLLAAENYINAGDIVHAEATLERLKAASPETPGVPLLEEKIRTARR